MKLLTAKQRAEGYYVEFDLLSMLRGDSKSRAEMLHIMRQDGVITADEWRAKEKYEPAAGRNRRNCLYKRQYGAGNCCGKQKAGEE